MEKIACCITADNLRFSRNMNNRRREDMAGNRKKILFLVEAMGGSVFTYMVDLANRLVKTYDIYCKGSAL